jgi:hypothetical protein
MHPYSIDVDYDVASKLIRQVLKEDYNATCEMIRALLPRIDLKPYELQDLELALEQRKAFEVLLRYYFYISEAENMITAQQAIDRMDVD